MKNPISKQAVGCSVQIVPSKTHSGDGMVQVTINNPDGSPYISVNVFDVTGFITGQEIRATVVETRESEDWT